MLEQLEKDCYAILRNTESFAARQELVPLDAVTFEAAMCRYALFHAGDLDKVISWMGPAS